jgi:hypothetical protein
MIQAYKRQNELIETRKNTKCGTENGMSGSSIPNAEESPHVERTAPPDTGQMNHHRPRMCSMKVFLGSSGLQDISVPAIVEYAVLPDLASRCRISL